MKFSINDFFSKCNQVHSYLHIRSHLLKKSLIETFIFQCRIKWYWGSKFWLLIIQRFAIFLCFFVHLFNSSHHAEFPNYLHYNHSFSRSSQIDCLQLLISFCRSYPSNSQSYPSYRNWFLYDWFLYDWDWLAIYIYMIGCWWVQTSVAVCSKTLSVSLIEPLRKLFLILKNALVSLLCLSRVLRTYGHRPVYRRVFIFGYEFFCFVWIVFSKLFPMLICSILWLINY